MLRSTAALLVGVLTASPPGFAIDDHLLLCEVALRPSGAEFIEIKNPSPTPISLDDYYLSDTSEYALLPGQFGSGPAPAIGAFDFIARFPPGSSLSPDGVAVIAVDGAGFLAAFGFPADFELLATDPSTPDMLEAFAGSIGGSAGLTDAGEATILFHWDGASDLVADADLFNAAEPSAGNQVGSKTGLFVDGPDVGTSPSFYADEAGSLPIQIATHGPSHSTKRIASEAAGDEVSGGNGISGDDETSEDSTVSWDDVFVLPDPGFCCLTLACYYSFVDDSSGTTARESLHDLIDDHHRIPYSSPTSWLILELAGEDPADPTRILDFYKNASYPKGTGQGVDFQREHAWPQSYGFPTDSGTSAYPRSDYHASSSPTRVTTPRAQTSPTTPATSAARKELPRPTTARAARVAATRATRTGASARAPLALGRSGPEPSAAVAATLPAPSSTWTCATTAAITARVRSSPI
jgi:hypothetical protein